jgi:hypothetical protein
MLDGVAPKALAIRSAVCTMAFFQTPVRLHIARAEIEVEAEA